MWHPHHSALGAHTVRFFWFDLISVRVQVAALQSLPPCDCRY